MYRIYYVAKSLIFARKQAQSQSRTEPAWLLLDSPSLGTRRILQLSVEK